MHLPPKVKTHYSIQEAFAHIPDLVSKAKELGYTHLPITDTHSLSGCPEFHRECTKQGVVPILGCDIRIENNTYVTLLAKNAKGWQQLIKILGASVLQDKIELVPKETLKTLITDDIYIVRNIRPEDVVLYVESEDHICQQILCYSKLKKTVNDKNEVLDKHPEFYTFLHENYNYLKEPSNYQNIDIKVESYDIKRLPLLPNPEDGSDPHEILTNHCRQGWKDKNLSALPPKLQKVYIDRIKYELEVFQKYNISLYMLIIHDMIHFARSKNATSNLRGSASGCLISYLSGISDIDPVWPDKSLEYHPDRSLIFERFINPGRFHGNSASLADVDLDVPISFRETMIEYLENKYGSDHIAHIITFGRLDGKGAIKEVFRVLDSSFDIANTITQYMVDTAMVQDVLQDIQEETPNYTIINYCLDNIPEVEAWYDEYKTEFDLAIKLSKTIRQTGKHAAGIVISPTPVKETFPTKIDEKTGKTLVALEMAEAESCGAVKYDILGVAALEKIDQITAMIEESLQTIKENIYV